MMTSAPSARSSRAFSCDILSGIVKMQRYPFTAAAIASPTPVLPLVASTIKPPGLSRPSRSAASIIARPMRSLTEPPGLKNSAFAHTGVFTPADTRFSRISGVQPIVSRTVAYGLACGGRGGGPGVGHGLGGSVAARGRIPARRRVPAGRIGARRRGAAHGGPRDGLRLGNDRRGSSGAPRLGRLRVPELDRLQDQRGNGDAMLVRSPIGQR